MTQPIAKEENLISHLIELRQRIFWAAASVIIVFVALYIYPGANKIFDLAAYPIINALPQGKLIATGTISPFATPLKLTGLAAFVIALPFVLYQVWLFVAPGLYKHEKRFVLPIIISSTLLFFAGAAFCYFIIFGKAFAYMQEIAPKSVTYQPDIEKYFDFVITMILACGISFETPLVVIILAWLGIVKVKVFSDIRRFVWLGITVVSAIVAPADAISMIALMIPMAILYEIGILVAKLIAPKNTTSDQNSNENSLN